MLKNGRIVRRFVSKRLFSSKVQDGIRPVRNIGIVAHVDAGKTTVTEKLLYLAGSTRVVGNVDSGNTVTDFLDMERERGITIQSAAVSFDWLQHRINLVDTPGHVDFTVEVERCLRVLDGVVCVLDGSAGVQAQTRTVWRQANKFSLPSVFFINKLDKKGADFARSVDSIEQKLGVKALCTVVPFKSDDYLVLVDVVSGKSLRLHNDEHWQPIKKGTREWDLLEEARSDLCYAIADRDDTFMANFLDHHGGDANKIEESSIINALRDVTLSGKASTVTCGSALRSTQCVTTVLDHVVRYLPSPEERNTELNELFGDTFSGFVFKITHDKRRGQLSYVRVYSGRLRNNGSVFNASQHCAEGPIRVFHPHADELSQVDFAAAGDIAVVAGLGKAITGDTLLANEASGREVNAKLNEKKSQTKKEDVHRRAAHDVVQPSSRTSSSCDVITKDDVDGHTVVFAGIDSPESVYFCCLEPPSARATHEFERALAELCREDPSLKIRADVETGQTIVETQGELHMEVVKDRLVRGYGLNVFVGPLQVAYREVLSSAVEHTAKVEEKMGEKSRPQSAAVTLRVEPSGNTGTFKRIDLEMPSGAHPVRNEWQKAISEGCSNALHNGPLASFPVQGVKITLTNLVASGGRINPALLSAAAHKCVSEALIQGGAVLVEPIMRVEITVSNAEGTQPLLQELARRRAQIDRSERINEDTTSVVAQIPLAEMENLSRVVRTLTSGYGTLHIQVSGYQAVSEHEQSAILYKMRGNL